MKSKQKDCVVYLFHATHKLHSQNGEHAIQHYVGSTERGFMTRVREHLGGRGAGAKVTELFMQNGGFEVARTWEGCGKDQEYYVKWQYKNLGRLCPICCGEEAYGRLPVEVLRGKTVSDEVVKRMRRKRAAQAVKKGWTR